MSRSSSKWDIRRCLWEGGLQVLCFQLKDNIDVAVFARAVPGTRTEKTDSYDIVFMLVHFLEPAQISMSSLNPLFGALKAGLAVAARDDYCMDCIAAFRARRLA